MNSNISIFVNGAPISSFEEMTASVDFTNLGGTFAFSSHNKNAANAGDAVAVQCGGRSFMSGVCMQKQGTMSKSGGTVWEFSGTDKLGFLGNCQVSDNMTFEPRASAKTIAETITGTLANSSDYEFSEVGALVSVDYAIDDIADGFSAAPGDNVAQLIGKLSSLVGKFAYAKGSGVIEFAKAGGGNDSKAINIIIGKHDISAITVVESIEGAASEITAVSDLNFNKQTNKENHVKVAKFPKKACMPNCIPVGDKTQLAKAVVQRRYEEIITDMLSVKIEMAGCLNPAGGAWKVNSRVYLSDETKKFGYGGLYNLRSAEIKKSKTSGTTSTITLCGLPLEPPQNGVRITTSNIKQLSGLFFTPVEEHRDAFSGGDWEGKL